MKQTIASNCTGSIRNLLRRCRNADNRRRKIKTSVAWHANTTARTMVRATAKDYAPPFYLANGYSQH